MLPGWVRQIKLCLVFLTEHVIIFLYSFFPPPKAYSMYEGEKCTLGDWHLHSTDNLHLSLYAVSALLKIDFALFLANRSQKAYHSTILILFNAPISSMQIFVRLKGVRIHLGEKSVQLCCVFT